MNSPDPVHGLTAENLLTAFPIALQGDQSSVALANVTAQLLARRPEEINRLLIYPAIAQLDEKLLDILAYDFKVDWWDADYSLEEKRRTLANSWQVHKLLGTKAAVEMAIRAIYPETMVEEWFEYEDGEPYHFRLSINITNDNVDSKRQRRVLERLDFYKNLRSHLDRVTYFMKPEPALAYAHGFLVATHVHNAAIITPAGVGPPRGVASPGAWGAMAGLHQQISADIEILTRPPEAKGAAFAVGVAAGRHHRMDASIDAPIENVGIQVFSLAQGLFCGSYRTINTGITLDTPAPAGIQVNGGAQGAYCGTYRKLKAEVLIDTMPSVTIKPSANARGAFCGTYRRFDTEISASIDQIHREGQVDMRGTFCGSRREMRTSIQTGIKPTITVATPRAGGKITGMHRKMIKEETINGALD